MSATNEFIRGTVAVNVRPVVPSDAPSIVELMRTTMGHGPAGEITAEFLAWKHHTNPFGRSLELVAEVGGTIVGYRSFMRWRFLRHGLPVTAVRPVDTVTHPGFQGRGIFSTLTRAALVDAVRDADLVFNTPNGRSLPGYLKMGWSPVGRVPVAVRVSRPLAFARGAAQSHPAAFASTHVRCRLPRASDVLDDDQAIQGLLDAADRADDRLRTDRDAAYLRWRYAEAPGLDYRALALRDGADLAGLAIGRPRRRGRLAEFTLSELIVRRGDHRTARRLLRHVAHCGVDHVATHLTGWPTADTARRTTGYFVLPRRGITLVARTLGDTLAAPLTLADWALSLGDLEVF